MRRLVVLGLLCLWLAACGAEGASGAQSRADGERMAEANRLYEEGRFGEAVSRYQGLVDSGVQDGRLYYNLGNAYFKTGDLGRAILNYRRAQLLLPRDGDVTANLELARDKTSDNIALEDEGAIIGLLRRLVAWISLDEAAIVALVLWVLLCGLLGGAILWAARRRAMLYLSAAVAVLLLWSIFSIGARLLDERAPAVVVATEVQVHSGPGEDYLTEFTLHAGAEVRLVERRGDWVRIALPGDLQGWAPGEALNEL